LARDIKKKKRVDLGILALPLKEREGKHSGVSGKWRLDLQGEEHPHLWGEKGGQEEREKLG